MGAASSEMPRVAACKLRSEDTLMRLLAADSFGTPLRSIKERELPERKYLSKGRKRNQLGFPK